MSTANDKYPSYAPSLTRTDRCSSQDIWIRYATTISELTNYIRLPPVKQIVPDMIYDFITFHMLTLWKSSTLFDTVYFRIKICQKQSLLYCVCCRCIILSKFRERGILTRHSGYFTVSRTLDNTFNSGTHCNLLMTRLDFYGIVILHFLQPISVLLNIQIKVSFFSKELLIMINCE